MEKYIVINFANTPGSIIRIALVLERRAYTIKSLNTMPLAEEGCSKMMLEVYGDSARFDQVLKQLAKLVDVISVKELVKETSRALLSEEVIPVAISA